MFSKGFLNKVVETEIEIEEKSLLMSMVHVYAYHCKRCNYVWLSKDFDYHTRPSFVENNEKVKWKYSGHDLLYRQPPKSCARCNLDLGMLMLV